MLRNYSFIALVVLSLTVFSVSSSTVDIESSIFERTVCFDESSFEDESSNSDSILSKFYDYLSQFHLDQVYLYHYNSHFYYSLSSLAIRAPPIS